MFASEPDKMRFNFPYLFMCPQHGHLFTGLKFKALI
jgi:hypothetical protein